MSDYISNLLVEHILRYSRRNLTKRWFLSVELLFTGFTLIYAFIGS